METESAKNLLSDGAVKFLEAARVGHLATADARGQPHVVPVVFVLVEGKIFTPIDGKPKKNPRSLRRLRNIRENPQIAFLVDRYGEDWTKLAFLLVRGSAAILEAGPATEGVAEAGEYRASEILLREKYPQYREVPLGGPERIMIRITPESCTTWGPL